MTSLKRTDRAISRIRLFFAPALAVAALSLTATASATVDSQPKPSLKVEASRGAQGARLVMQGKNFPANARVVITATRAPGTNGIQKFGTVTADSTGEFKHTATAQCTTSNMDDAREQVTFTAADSASGTKVTAKVDGSSWMCM
jgi:hypothetical protein